MSLIALVNSVDFRLRARRGHGPSRGRSRRIAACRRPMADAVERTGRHLLTLNADAAAIRRRV
jgi:hypothetical protein